VPPAKFCPTLPFGLLQGRNDPGPFHRPGQGFQLRLFPAVGAQPLPQPPRKFLASQYHPGHQPFPGGLDAALAHRLLSVLPQSFLPFGPATASAQRLKGSLQSQLKAAQYPA
jgi:hypothetical protein